MRLDRRGFLSSLLALPALRWLKPAPPAEWIQNTPSNEAMACGVPNIVPDWSALGEWARPAARLVPCSESILADVEALIEAAEKETIYGPYAVYTPFQSLARVQAAGPIEAGDFVRSKGDGTVVRCGRRTSKYALGFAVASVDAEGLVTVELT